MNDIGTTILVGLTVILYFIVGFGIIRNQFDMYEDTGVLFTLMNLVSWAFFAPVFIGMIFLGAAMKVAKKKKDDDDES